MAWSAGQILQDGKYTVKKVLGQGGFGITYLAIDNYLDRNIVLKTFNEKLIYDPNFSKFEEKFINEARSLAKFRHSHIVQIYEYFKEHQILCLVMEYILGDNLYNIIDKKGALPEVEALNYIQQIGSALIAVHKQHFLHLDVNPNNIILRTGTSEVVLIDFGIAHNFKVASTTELLPVSQGYSPPEQYSTQLKTGTYSDVYSLAATLYFLLTKIPPVPAIDRFLGKKLDYPKDLKISDNINHAILVGMSLEAKDRPQSIKEWLRLLGLKLEENLIIKQEEFVEEPHSKFENPKKNKLELFTKKLGLFQFFLHLF